jgi:hypothetical protein
MKKNVNDNENVIETSRLIDFDGIDIDQHEHMTNVITIYKKNDIYHITINLK